MKSTMSKRIIIFDGQVFQSTAWDRGMGKYSLNLLAALYKEKSFDYKRKLIVFAKGKKLTQEAEATIKKTCPGIEFIYLDLRVPKVLPGEDIRPLQIANQKILEKYIESITSDVPDFVILSLLIDQYVAAFPSNARKILLFYDLIPLQYSDRYGKMWSYPNYLRRFKTIFESDLILTISQTVADDLAVYTGINSNIIRSIVGGPIDRNHLKSKKPNIDLPKKFILMPSGNDMRKNNFRAIQGFEEFRLASGKEDYKLVITSHFDAKTQKTLDTLSDGLIFTGNVIEAELKWLYEETDTLLFVSEYEGLGLPILEAAEVDKPIVCSNLTVFNEMSTTAFYYADQHNPSSIANALEVAVSGAGFTKKLSSYPEIIKRYTWKNTALQTLDALSGPVRLHDNKIKPKLAVFAPNPNGYSAIGKVIALNHHALSEHFDVEYFLEEGRSGNTFSRQSFLDSVARVRNSREFNATDYAKYDAVVYHIGNSEYHLDSIKNALHLPGYLVIHDTRLKEAYEDVLVRYAYMDQGRLEAERKLEKLFTPGNTVYMTSLVNSSLGVITHSDYAQKAIKGVASTGQIIKKLNLPAATPELKKLKIGTRFNVGFAGIIHKAKGINIIDQIIASPDFQDVDVYIFGVPLVEAGVLERLESFPNVRIEKNLTDFEFETRLAEMDAVVSYRPSYNGETSLTVVEAMRHGVVPVVRNVGWFGELPDETVEKAKNEQDVLDCLKNLIADPKRIEAKKQAAKEYTTNNFTYTLYAEGLRNLVEEVANDDTEATNKAISSALKSKLPKDSILDLLSEQS